jgi:hypothetical protein
MSNLFGPEQRHELVRRGFTRRDFGRLAALVTGGTALPFYNGLSRRICGCVSGR